MLAFIFFFFFEWSAVRETERWQQDRTEHVCQTTWMHPCTNTISGSKPVPVSSNPLFTTCMLGGSNHTTDLPISPQQPWLIGFIPFDIFNQQTAKRQSRSKSAAGERRLTPFLSSCWRCMVLTISSSIFSKRNIDKWTLFEYLWAASPR